MDHSADKTVVSPRAGFITHGYVCFSPTEQLLHLLRTQGYSSNRPHRSHTEGGEHSPDGTARKQKKQNGWLVTGREDVIEMTRYNGNGRT